VTGAGTGLPAAAPRTDPDNDVFWKGTERGVLLLQRCDDCAVVIWYPRFFCPSCGSTSTSWSEATGRGEVYTFTVVRKSRRAGWDAAVPYVVAVVELAEGPRVLTNIVGCEPDSVRIGMPVRVTFVPTDDRAQLYRFRLEEGAAG
jgi:uncharacterized OB-fold protein